jgi:hypothetical protein
VVRDPPGGFAAVREAPGAAYGRSRFRRHRRGYRRERTATA